MKAKSSLAGLASRALSESLDFLTILSVTNEILPGYDVYKRMGYRESMSIPSRDAARQILADINEAGLFNELASFLIQMQLNGYKGRPCNISHLKDIIRELQDSGFIYDQENKIFVENSKTRRTKNWGALVEGREYVLTFLRIDIVGNSQIVRENPESAVTKAYDDLRKIVQSSVDRRNGRIWTWEGDGGLCAFYFSYKNKLATLAGMEIINELYLWNRLHNPLSKPLEVRIAIHSGHCDYTENIQELMKNDVIKKTIMIESKHTQPNSMTISNTVRLSVDTTIEGVLTPMRIDDSTVYCSYSVVLEG